MNRTIAKLFRKAASLHGRFDKQVYKHLKKTYKPERNARWQVRKFLWEKQKEKQDA